jgi:pilus assembly protein Flp/PilA
MRRLRDAVRRFVKEEKGAALVEYAFLIALIAIVAIVVVATLGNKVSEKFSELESKF